MIPESARVQLRMQSRPENVALARAALSGLAVAAEFDAELTADLKTAVSEACNNVVLHAYGEAGGEMLLDVACTEDSVVVKVSDSGAGLTRISSRADRMGLGLAVISALASRSQFLTTDGGGTTVMMRFDRQRVEGGEAGAEARAADTQDLPTSDFESDVLLTVVPPMLLGDLLGPILRVLAASVGFSIARVAELRDVNAALAAFAVLSTQPDVRIGLTSSTRRVSITGGPFALGLEAETGDDPRGVDTEVAGQNPGAAQRRPLRELVDELTTAPLDGGRLVRLVLTDAGSLGATARQAYPSPKSR